MSAPEVQPEPAQPVAAPSAGVQSLSTAVIDGYYTPLKGLAKHLEELEVSQTGWLSKLSEEQKHQIQIETELKEVQKVFLQIPQYVDKVKQMSKDMQAIQASVRKLSASANKLADKKRKEEQAQQEKDRMLMARPAQSLVQQQQERQNQPPPANVGRSGSGHVPKIGETGAASATAPK